MIKKSLSKKDLEKIITDNFNIKTADQKGVDASKVHEVVGLIFNMMEISEKEAKEGSQQLATFFGSHELKDDLILMLREIWENNRFNVHGRETIK